MHKSDIGILFDVSGSMQQPFNSFDFKYSSSKADEIIDILKRFCARGKNSNNENIRIFSLLFGGTKELIYDFGSIMEIANSKFNYVLTSDENSKARIFGWGGKIEDILSEHGNKKLYLYNYLYCDSGPSEKLCEMGCHLLEHDVDLRERIYNKLPYDCKSKIENIGIATIQWFISKKINRSTEETINEIYEICMNEYASKIINEEYNKRKNSGNSLRFIDGNDLIKIQNNLEKKLTSPKKSNFNLMDLISQYIYGNTPLYTALNLSFDNFKKQSNNNTNKYLFIISDGELNDIDKNFDYIKEIRDKATSNNIIIISIFLTANGIPKCETFYDEIQPHFTNGSKDLFLMSSTLTYEHPIIKFFIKKGWNMPISGECKLFVEINNSQNMDKFIDLMNEAIGELNYKNNIEKIENPNSLISLIASTKLDYYVNSNINETKAGDQGDKKTCYANAIAATICLASARVYTRKTLDFLDVRNKLENKYGKNGIDLFKALNESLGQYKLRYRLIDEEKEARKAIIETRPCLAIFKLTGMQKENFKEFFQINPKGILTKEILNKPRINSNNEKFSHSVVLTHISKNYLKFLNSWGTNWGDNGYFKIENANVLNAEFIDIYWELDDLDKNEKDNYIKYLQELRLSVNENLFK